MPLDDDNQSCALLLVVRLVSPVPTWLTLVNEAALSHRRNKAFGVYGRTGTGEKTKNNVGAERKSW